MNVGYEIWISSDQVRFRIGTIVYAVDVKSVVYFHKNWYYIYGVTEEQHLIIKLYTESQQTSLDKDKLGEEFEKVKLW